MAGTGRWLVMPGEGGEITAEIDSDVLVTEQRTIDMGLSPTYARSTAALVVDAALNLACPCCVGGHDG